MEKQFAEELLDGDGEAQPGWDEDDGWFGCGDGYVYHIDNGYGNTPQSYLDIVERDD